MKQFLAATFILISALSFSQQELYNLDWGFSLGTSDEEYLSRVMLTPQEDLLMCGNYMGGLDFDPGVGTNIPPIGQANGWYVAEYDTSGALNWVTVWDGLSASRCQFQVDPTGNIYMFGTTGGNIGTNNDFDPGPGTFNLTVTNECYFLVKLDPNGVFLDAAILGEGNVSQVNGVQASCIFVDASQNVYLAGWFDNVLDFNPGGAPALDTGDVDGSIFVQKLDANWNSQWVNVYDNGGAFELVVDDNSNVYLGGYCVDTIDFDPGPGQDLHVVFGVGASTAFIQKMDSNGNMVWTSTYDDGDFDSFSGIQVNSTGDIFVAGTSGFGQAGGALRILRYDDQGTMIWDKAIGNTQAFNRSQGIQLDDLNNVYISGPFVGIIDFDPNPITEHLLSSGTGVNGGTYVLKLSENGDYIWAHGMDNYLWTNPNADLLALDSDDNIYFGACIQGDTDVEPGSNVTTLPNAGGSDIALMRLSPNPCAHFYATMDSLVHGDCNGPGYAEASAYNGTGSYTYLWDNVPPSDSTSAILTDPGVYTVAVTDSLGCVYESAVLVNMPTTMTGFDLNVNMIHTTFIFPGDSAAFVLDAFNDGCQPQSGTISVIFQDTLLENLSFNPPPSGVFGDSVVWNFPTSVYGDPHFIVEISGEVDTLAQFGDSINIDVVFLPIAGDYDSLNNVKDYYFEVTNSYDPNYKSVYPSGVCPEHFVEKDRTLTYTVHFQNTGTAAAQNISVLDELDPNLDLNSVRVLSQSHPMIMEVFPPNTIEFRFDDIMLADSASNEPASHGWFVFEVDPVQGLPDNTVIDNSVGIYFDYNPPVITNTVSITYVDEIECFLGLDEVQLSETGVLVYPNPSTGSFTVESQIEGSFDYFITSIEGKEVLSGQNQSSNQFDVDLSNEPNGLYWLTILNNEQRVTVKLIVL